MRQKSDPPHLGLPRVSSHPAESALSRPSTAQAVLLAHTPRPAAKPCVSGGPGGNSPRRERIGHCLRAASGSAAMASVLRWSPEDGERRHPRTAVHGLCTRALARARELVFVSPRGVFPCLCALVPLGATLRKNLSGGSADRSGEIRCGSPKWTSKLHSELCGSKRGSAHAGALAPTMPLLSCLS